MQLAFTACSPDSWWCSIAYWVTTSGGPIGFPFLLLITGFCYALRGEGRREKILIFFKATVSLILFFGSLAWVNENFTKPILKAHRPSHVYMLTQTGKLSDIDSLYQQSAKVRKVFFAKLINDHPQNFRDIDFKVQEHWIEEAGFSFPSGHTFNAFLFAMILAYAIYFNRSMPRYKMLFIPAFVWATAMGISRVAIGAHSALDVCAGAALGIIIGMVFLYIDKTRHWLIRK